MDPIEMVKASGRPVNVKLYKGGDLRRCSPWAVPYGNVNLAPGETRGAGCRGGSGCVVALRVRN